jgi:hypothetical protein
MIRLQARPGLEPAIRDLSGLIVEPVMVVAVPSMKPVVLTQNVGLAEVLDAADGMVEKLESEGAFQNGGWRLVKRGSVVYQAGRVVYDCLAVKVIGGRP